MPEGTHPPLCPPASHPFHPVRKASAPSHAIIQESLML